MGAGTGVGAVAVLICCQKRGGGTHFSPDKLFAYQLTLVKEKNIPSAICSQSGAGVGPGASRSSGSQTQFQNPRQLPPGLFWEAAQLRGTPAFEAFPITPKLFAHPTQACQLLLGPWTSSTDAHYKYPASNFCCNFNWSQISWDGGEGARALNGGSSSLSAPCQSPVWEPLPAPTYKHPDPPGVHPVPGLTPPPFSPQASVSPFFL